MRYAGSSAFVNQSPGFKPFQLKWFQQLMRPVVRDSIGQCFASCRYGLVTPRAPAG